jgi:hypothetical protein
MVDVRRGKKTGSLKFDQNDLLLKIKPLLIRVTRCTLDG